MWGIAYLGIPWLLACCLSFYNVWAPTTNLPWTLGGMFSYALGLFSCIVGSIFLCCYYWGNCIGGILILGILTALLALLRGASVWIPSCFMTICLTFGGANDVYMDFCCYNGYTCCFSCYPICCFMAYNACYDWSCYAIDLSILEVMGSGALRPYFKWLPMAPARSRLAVASYVAGARFLRGLRSTSRELIASSS